MNTRNATWVEIVEVIWKRKWTIAVPALLCALAVGVWSFLSKPVWEVSCLVRGGRVRVEMTSGLFQEVEASPPSYIVGQVEQGAYVAELAAAFGIDARRFPRLRIEHIKDTKLLRISLRTKDREKGMEILNALFRELQAELDRKVDVEITALDSQIRRSEIEKARLEEVIKTTGEKVAIVRRRREEIEKERGSVRERIRELEKEQMDHLRKGDRTEAGSLGLLLYSNEIQQSLRYLDALQELLSTKGLEEMNLLQDIQNRLSQFQLLDNEIVLLEGKKARIDKTEMIVKPTPSNAPVHPKKTLNVLIAFLLGLAVFGTLAFFLESWEKIRVGGS